MLDVWKFFLKKLRSLFLVTQEEVFFTVMNSKEFEERIAFKICPYKTYGIYYIKDCGVLLKIPMECPGINKSVFNLNLKPHMISIRGAFNPSKIQKNNHLPILHCQSLRDIEKYIITWANAQKWFSSKDISHKLGILLYGPPGTGKSFFIKRISQILYDINCSFYAQSLINYNDSIIALSPQARGISYIEDLDRLYHCDQCMIPNGPTFDRLLKTLDDSAGLVFITVNDITKLDPAIAQLTEDGRISRPGRIDRVVYVGVADEQGRRDCAAHILSEWPHLIDKVVHEGEGETIAQFSDRCKTLAVKMYWQSQVDKPTDLK